MQCWDFYKIPASADSLKGQSIAFGESVIEFWRRVRDSRLKWERILTRPVPITWVFLLAVGVANKVSLGCWNCESLPFYVGCSQAYALRLAFDLYLHTLLFTNDPTNLAFGILHLFWDNYQHDWSPEDGALTLPELPPRIPSLSQTKYYQVLPSITKYYQAYQAYHRPSPLNERCNALSNSRLIPSWLLDQHSIWLTDRAQESSYL